MATVSSGSARHSCHVRQTNAFCAVSYGHSPGPVRACISDYLRVDFGDSRPTFARYHFTSSLRMKILSFPFGDQGAP
jgi:hypothetical protein